MNLDDLTLIIPTHERHSYLKRVLDYYSRFNLSIYIVDSSTLPYSIDGLKSNMKYVHVPGISYTSKMEQAFNQVNSTFSVLCADDDFIVPASMGKCRDFLISEPEYVSVQGYYNSFYQEGTNIKYYPNYTHSINLDINSGLPSGRLNQLFGSYMHLIYSVHLTRVFREFFQQLHQITIKNPIQIEVLHSCYNVISGKHKVLPCFYGFRQRLPHSDGATHQSFSDILSNQPSGGSELERLQQIISRWLTAEEELTPEEANKVIQSAFSRYINTFPSTRQSHRNNAIRNILNEKLAHSLETNYMKLKRKKKYKELNSLVRNLEGYPQGDPVAGEQLNDILDFVRSHKIIE